MTTNTDHLATTIRAHALRMIAKAKASHVGTCLSMADLLAVLYGAVLRVDPKQPQWPERDRLIVSKGHGAAILYAVLAERGFFPVADLSTYSQDGSPLTGHVSHHVPGVELSTGSLGHGLPVGCGLALAAKREHLSPLPGGEGRKRAAAPTSSSAMANSMKAPTGRRSFLLGITSLIR